MLKKKRKETYPELLDPGAADAEPCSPGSIEQQLDMCEQGGLRGEDVERHIENSAVPMQRENQDPLPLDVELNAFDDTMAEGDREGSELSGDDHSSGLQGGEPELESQPHHYNGLPGDGSRIEDQNRESLTGTDQIRQIRRSSKLRKAG